MIVCFLSTHRSQNKYNSQPLLPLSIQGVQNKKYLQFNKTTATKFTQVVTHVKQREYYTEPHGCFFFGTRMYIHLIAKSILAFHYFGCLNSGVPDQAGRV